MVCSRCGIEVGDSIHLVLAPTGDKRARLEQMGYRVTVCSEAIYSLAQEILCPNCHQFLFEYTDQRQCPLCDYELVAE